MHQHIEFCQLVVRGGGESVMYVSHFIRKDVANQSREGFQR